MSSIPSPSHRTSSLLRVKPPVRAPGSAEAAVHHKGNPTTAMATLNSLYSKRTGTTSPKSR